MKMRIGVLSDTHLQRVSRELEEIFEKYLSDKDLVLHAGDIVSTEIVDFLCQRDLQAVYGNMDPPEVRSVLPARTVMELGPYRVGLTHGGGSNKGLEARVRSEFRGVDVIVYGHSHIPVNHVKEGVLLFNPGTATGFSFSGIHTLGILELNDGVHGEIIRV
jgi:putative phosphoesterase